MFRKRHNKVRLDFPVHFGTLLQSIIKFVRHASITFSFRKDKTVFSICVLIASSCTCYKVLSGYDSKQAILNRCS